MDISRKSSKFTALNKIWHDKQQIGAQNQKKIKFEQRISKLAQESSKFTAYPEIKRIISKLKQK